MRVLVLIALIVIVNSGYGQELKGDLLIASQLNEWCMSHKPIRQQFCQAYLYGIYETTDCKFRITTPGFEDLRTTFVTWLFVKGDDSYVYAVESALASFKDKYGCE